MIRAEECPVLTERTPSAAAVLRKDMGDRVVRSRVGVRDGVRWAKPRQLGNNCNCVGRRFLARAYLADLWEIQASLFPICHTCQLTCFLLDPLPPHHPGTPAGEIRYLLLQKYFAGKKKMAIGPQRAA